MLVRICTAILATVCLLQGPIYGADKPITIGLIPDGLTQDERAPLRAYLTKAMGRPVNLVVPDHYADTVANLANGTYDFACLGALMYVRAHAQHAVVPLVQRTSDRQFHSVFITGANTSIHSLQDLRGRQFAYGDINSASAHLMPHFELKAAGINPETELKTRYSGSHPVTAAMVEMGVVEAGVLDETVFTTMVASGKIDREKVRIFYTSKPFVDYVYVARKGLPEEERDKFVRALLALKPGENDAVLKVLRAKQFVQANDQEYETIRRIARELKMF